jgi:hypothetical protein
VAGRGMFATSGQQISVAPRLGSDGCVHATSAGRERQIHDRGKTARLLGRSNKFIAGLKNWLIFKTHLRLGESMALVVPLASRASNVWGAGEMYVCVGSGGDLCLCGERGRSMS